MKNSIILKTILFISGSISAGIGAAILLIPVAFHTSSGLELGNDSSLLNEIRAPGGALLSSGLLILSGVFRAKLTFTATIVATLLYLSYASSRLLSFWLDGMPSDALIQVTGAELVIGLFCLFALIKYRNDPII